MEAMVSYDANLEVCRDEANESGPDAPTHCAGWPTRAGSATT